ncbi:hypothetical protein CFS9_35620 [Flavobacterium sp. CFS9]|uniref:Lipoprotein n=1 Tax=Flavobacterium sp. CFS9 TaxID=3143118 RepID=A0AAT9H632_9FLAO
MTKSFIFASLLALALISCNSKENKEEYKHAVYHAIHQGDTAVLDIQINNKRFFGRYEIFYHKIGKDSGDVRGDIKGDTLRGDYHFISNGGSWKRVPLALLQKDNKLFLGKGVIGTYFNLPLYMPEVPIEYENSEFVFEKVKE